MRDYIKALFATCLLVTSMSALAASQSQLTQHWSQHNEDNSATIDHSAFATFLDKYLVVRDDAPNLVRYAKVTPQAHDNLEAYIEHLTEVPLANYSRDVQLAYWINLYNAALLDLVLDHYPVDSVTDIGGFASSPWEVPVVTIDGYRLTLHDIRQYILQPIWKETVIRYGLSRAAIGGPELRAKPYSDDDIFVQLADNAKHFVNSPQGLQIKDSKLVLSKFFERNRHDFGRSTTALISEVREHAQPALSARLDIFDEISGFQFNWALNDANRLD